MCRPLPEWEFKDYLGWMEQGDGRLAYGVFVQNGRLKGELKAALRRVIERYELPVIITAIQNIILTEIHPSWKADILDTLSGAGVRWRSMLLWCFTYFVEFLTTPSLQALFSGHASWGGVAIAP